MQIVGIVVGCVLLGQVSDAIIPPPATLDRKSAVLEPLSVGDSEKSLPPVAQPPAQSTTPRPARLSSGAMVADAIALPSGSTVTGQPIPLVAILSSTPDRRLHLELARTYWRLFQAVADYRYCFGSVQDLKQVKSPGEESAALRLSKASAAAELREAELEATRWQCELARLARLPAASAMPLPADRPHAGSYRTNYQELFAGRTPPESAMLMERILPLRRQAIDDQAAAVQAADDAWQAAAELQSAGRSDDSVLATCRQELLQRQRAFIRVVCEYNSNIAEYGLAVASPASTPQQLVAMLIGPTQQASAAAIANGPMTPATAPQSAGNPMRQAVRTEPGSNAWRTVQPNQSQQPIPTQAPNGLPKNEPTPAPLRGAGAKNEPTLAPPRESVRQASGEEPAELSGHLQVLEGDVPTFEPADNGAAADDGAAGDAPVNLEDQPLVPVDFESSESTPETRETKKPALDDNPATSADASSATISPFYPALVSAAPAIRAKQLAVTLHWDRSLPENAGKPMSLTECMMRDGGSDRRGTIEAYWKVRECAARHQSLTDQSELLEALVPIVLDRRKDPSGATDMLRLRSAQMAARAAVDEAHVALVEAQFALAARLGALGDASWPLASTVPHSGSYLLKLDAQPQSVIESWPVRRMTASIPMLSESVQQRATAVVEADAARVAAVQRYSQGKDAVDNVIEGVAAQTRQTLALLETLTEYNRTIADYVLTVLPPNTPADRLVATLVVKP